MSCSCHIKINVEFTSTPESLQYAFFPDVMNIPNFQVPLERPENLCLVMFLLDLLVLLGGSLGGHHGTITEPTLGQLENIHL